MSRILAAAPLGVAVLLVPAAAALTPPHVPTATVPTVTTPPVTTPVATVPGVTVPGTTLPQVTVPTVTVPTVSVPTATVPSVTVPPPPVRIPPPPVRTGPLPKTPTPIVSTGPGPAPATPPATPVQAPPSRSSDAEYPTTSYGSSSNASSASGPARVRVTRSLKVKKFRLARAATVHVTVWQESPRCRLFGRFGVEGARGSNTLRLPKRIAGRRLVVGAYRLVGLADGREVIDLHVRVERAHGRLHVRSAPLLADACLATPGAESLSAAAVFPLSGGERGPRSGSAPTSGVRGATKSAGPQTAAAGPRSSDAAGHELSAAVRHTLLFVLLGLAIALLSVSSLPESFVRPSGAGAALARHRAALTSAGLAMIVAAALAAALG